MAVKIKGAKQAFITKIRILYFIEKDLIKILPKLEKVSSDQNLKESFYAHQEETRIHVERLEEIFNILNEKPKKLVCQGIRGIIEDCVWVMEYDAPPRVKDAMIASAARYAEHYEMAGYMGAIIEADALGLKDVKELLETTLDEEQNTEEQLELAMENNLDSENAEQDLEEEYEV